MSDVKVPKWSKKPLIWIEDRVLYISVVFTYHLPWAKRMINERSLLWDKVSVGGPAIDMMPGYIEADDVVSVGGSITGVLQRHNPMATRTTTGCIRHCKFCAIGRGLIEPGGLCEVEHFIPNPIVVDNNILAASIEHFDRVIEMLKPFGWCDFNQGIDARLLTKYHAERINEIHKPIVRLALDSMSYVSQWELAYDILRSAGIRKASIKSYAIIGFRDSPEEAWERCEYISGHGIDVLPMWYHPLDALEQNVVYDFQVENGWSESERKRIMGWYYRRRGEKPNMEDL